MGMATDDNYVPHTKVRPRILDGWRYSIARLPRGGWAIRAGIESRGSTDLRTFTEHSEAQAYASALRDFGAHEDE